MTVRSPPHRLLDAGIAFAVTAAACLALVPAVVNGDGLGHLRATISGALAPGHLAFLPLLRLVGRLTGAHDALALLSPARALCIVSAGLAAVLTADTARTLLGAREHARLSALLAGAGLGVSFGTLQAGSDVETYAPALCAACLAAACAARRAAGGGLAWTLATGLAVASAALLHVENVLLAPAAALLAARAPDAADAAPPRTRLRIVDALIVLSVSGAAVVACYVLAAHARGDDLAGALRFIGSASHGFAYPLGRWTPVAAVYGAARTLIVAPYPDDAGWPRVIAQALLGVAAGAALVLAAVRSDRPRTLGRLVAAAWVLPYAVVGAVFFASDNERWIFLLPPTWIVVGAAASTSLRSLRHAAAVTTVILVCNLALHLPAARDSTRRDQADRVAAQLLPGDLVVSPGHGWDEYIGFYRTVAIEPFPLVYYAGLFGPKGMARELARHAGWAHARGGRVFVVRAHDPRWTPGWKDLVPLGVTPENLDRYLPAGRRTALSLDLVRLDPPAPAPATSATTNPAAQP